MYRTAEGSGVDYATKYEKPIRETLPDTAEYIRNLWRLMITLDYKLSVAMQDNVRLKHENELMVRLMSEKENKQ